MSFDEKPENAWLSLNIRCCSFTDSWAISIAFHQVRLPWRARLIAEVAAPSGIVGLTCEHQVPALVVRPSAA
jgi:hypothetical protein